MTLFQEKQLLMGITKEAEAGSQRGFLDQIDVSDCPVKYKLYKERWLILAVCCLLALSNAMQWISYITLTIETRTFYCEDGVDCEPAFTTNQIFQLVAVLTGIGGMYITDVYGIRLSIMFGVTFNSIGSLIRLISASPQIVNSYIRLSLLHFGSTIVAAAQAFFLVLPSKIAECWFPEDQRAISNVLTFIANPAGVALGTLTPQLFFQSQNKTDVSFSRQSSQLFHYDLIMASLTTTTFVFSFFIKRSLPPTPPSPANQDHATGAPSFWPAILICLKNKQFVVQLFTFALGFAQLWGVMVVFPDILDSIGYSISGYATAICALVGVISSILAGAVADKTKKFKEIVQFCSVGFFLSAVLTRGYLEKKRQGIWDDVTILFLSSLLGAFSIPQFPIGIEMGVETTFPVFEATSSGLLVLSGQLWMFFLYALFMFVGGLPYFYETSTNIESIGNWQLILDIWCVLCFTTAIITLFCLQPTYKRLIYEKNQTNYQNSLHCSRHRTSSIEHKDLEN
ncbi:unnamed protein product [Auanema sp. JU1783]|nr:unnamed protein product [Auanema sp. JU1783]